MFKEEKTDMINRLGTVCEKKGKWISDIDDFTVITSIYFFIVLVIGKKFISYHLVLKCANFADSGFT